VFKCQDVYRQEYGNQYNFIDGAVSISGQTTQLAFKIKRGSINDYENSCDNNQPCSLE
jgi:hypothetical protein